MEPMSSVARLWEDGGRDRNTVHKMRNEKLEAFIRQIVGPLGHEFCQKYKYPLLAFITLEETSEETRDVVARGLTHSIVKTSLEDILNNDQHLMKCCGDADHLARTIDMFFLKKLTANHFPGSQSFGFVQDELEAPLSDFDQVLYERGPFQRYAYFHLFDLTIIDECRIQPPYEEWFIQKVEPQTVSVLFGESSVRSFISPPLTGTWFLVCRDTTGFEAETLENWLIRRWKEAAPFRRVLQYSIDGIVDIDYVCPYFSPDWVNDIHRWGLYYVGSPRRDDIPLRLQTYVFDHNQEAINRMWRTYVRHQTRMTESGSTLRRAIRIAGEFYEDYHRKLSRAEQFASLMIALEALFTPSDQTEHTFRISQNCALLACESYDSTGRQEIFEFLKIMFKRRGRLFHGQFDSSEESPDGLASDEEIGKLSTLVRTSILRFMALFLQGENNLENLRKSLQMAALDESLRDELLHKGDYEALINDSQTSLLPMVENGNRESGVGSTVEIPPAPAPSEAHSPLTDC